MLALHDLYHMLGTFRPLFSRHTPWVLFCVVILGFIGTPYLESISSLCRQQALALGMRLGDRQQFFFVIRHFGFHLDQFVKGYPRKAGHFISSIT